MDIASTCSLTYPSRWNIRAESIGGAIFRLGDEIAGLHKFVVAMLLFQGAQAGDNPNQIPVHTTRGVLWGLMLMVFADVLIALLRGLL
jgi:hypothetical protein